MTIFAMNDQTLTFMIQFYISEEGYLPKFCTNYIVVGGAMDDANEQQTPHTIKRRMKHHSQTSGNSLSYRM